MFHFHCSSQLALCINARCFPSIQVPPGLETINSRESSSHLETSAASGQGNKRKFSRRPSKKLVANGLLLLGVFCLSRGHPPLGANVAMAYILKRLTKRGATPSQSGQS